MSNTPTTDPVQTDFEGEEMREPPKPIPVRARFYLTKCPTCDWVGSSEQCGVDEGCDDSDVYCPVCQEGGCEEDPSVAEAARHGEAIMQRIAQLQADLIAVRKERDAFEQEGKGLRERLGELQGAPATPSGSHPTGDAAGASSSQSDFDPSRMQWPSGCIKPNACARHGMCMYAMSSRQCHHFGKGTALARDIARANDERAQRENAKRSSPKDASVIGSAEAPNPTPQPQSHTEEERDGR